jgi:two-component system, OmpR family, sensor kinase
MRQPRGVRTRLLTVVVVSVAAALAVMTLGFNVLLARSLSRDADSLLRSRAATEAASVNIVNDHVVAPDQPDTGGLESQAWVFRGSRTLEQPRVSAALDRAAQRAAAAPGVSVDVPGLDTRLYAMPAADDPSTVVVAGVSLAPYQHTQRIALVGSLALAAALLVLVALVARWMLRAALQPVARMTADAEAWSEHDPERRFAAGEPYDELSQLAATLDGLLDGLAAGLRREQRFSAEMSHELRTPLAKVRAEAELALRRERRPEEYRQALETILRNTQQMSAAIEMLVSAAQQESGLARGRSNAGAVLRDVAETCSTLAAERGIELSVGALPTSLDVGVDLDVAVRVLQPVVENACGFAGTRVDLSAERDQGGVLIHVDDDGPGVQPGEVETIFAPGVRGSAAGGAAEAGGPAGAGLGLALARRLARAGGGDVVARPGGGGHFVVRLPAG